MSDLTFLYLWLCVLKQLCCCHGQLLFPSLGTDPDLHLESPPSPSPPTQVLPSDVPTLSLSQCAPPIPLATVMFLGGHTIEAVLIIVILRLCPGNAKEVLDSKLVFVA